MQLKTSQLEPCWQRGATKARFAVGWPLFAVVASLFAWASFPVDVTGAELEGSELTFEKDIRPIFREHCYDCHGATDQLEGNLDLRLVRFMVRGGESGPAILANQPEQSLLLSRLRAGEMPPGAVPVPEEQIATIERWIAAGAPTADEILDEASTLVAGIDPRKTSVLFFVHAGHGAYRQGTYR